MPSDTDAAARPAVTVVGGGLAGMTAALRLGELGCAVELLEAREELGGEAGSKRIDGRWEDHGYHVFFPWYLNTFRLIDELGIGANFRDSFAYYQLQVGDYPGFPHRWSGISGRVRPSDLRTGSLPVPDQMLYYYALIDMMSQGYDRADRDESVGDFLRGRWYLTPGVRSEFDRLVKTSVIDTDEHSARSLRRAMAFFARHMSPLYRMPMAPLQEAFIGPFRDRLEKLGVRVRTGTRLAGVQVRGDRVAEVHLQTPGGPESLPVKDVVMAIPHHDLAGVGELVDRAGAAGFRGLRSEPLAALHLYFARPIPHLPRDHIRLVGSRYELTFVDLARNHSGLDGSVLNFCLVPGDLAGRAADDAARAVVEEVRRYIPTVSWDDVKHAVFQPNADQPFYSNETHSWDVRPGTATALGNLWLAGDYVRSHIDIAGMENAVTTGLLAADAVREARGLGRTPLEILRPREVSPAVATAVKAALAPAAFVARRLSR